MTMSLKVACLVHPTLSRYRKVADAMIFGIARCGDTAYAHSIDAPMLKNADVAVCYGWKRNAQYRDYPRFVYADLGYWHRDTHYRLVAGSWSPDGYVRAQLPRSRLDLLGVSVNPWRTDGDTIVIAGSTGKSCVEHGLGYREWETRVAAQLQGCGKRVVYRPKPTDRNKAPLRGVEYDDGPLAETLARSWALVTHHSNAAVDALVAGVPVHCETGVAAAFSVPLDQIDNPPLLEGREQFLADVAWLNWSLEEMRSGDAWAHMKERGLLC